MKTSHSCSVIAINPAHHAHKTRNQQYKCTCNVLLRAGIIDTRETVMLSLHVDTHRAKKQLQNHNIHVCTYVCINASVELCAEI